MPNGDDTAGTPKPAPSAGTTDAASTVPLSPEAKAAKGKLDAKHGKAKKGVKAVVEKNLSALSNQFKQPRGILMEFFDALDELHEALGTLKGKYDWREIFLGSEGLSRVRLVKMQLLLEKQKEIPKGKFDKLAANEGELATVKPAETDGAFMYRIYGMLPPTPPKWVKDVNAYLIRTLIIKLKISDKDGKRTFLGRKKIWYAMEADKDEKKPSLHKGDPVFFMYKKGKEWKLGGGPYVGKTADKKIVVRTAKGEKSFSIRDAFFAQSMKGNKKNVGPDRPAEKPKDDKDKKDKKEKKS